jgi:hypothetical protein
MNVFELRNNLIADRPWLPGRRLADPISARGAALTRDTHDLAPSARDPGYDGPPFPWDPDRRHHHRCEPDAAFLHLYGLNRDDTAYILDTFPIVRDKEEKQFGEYRTKRRVLELYDEYAGAQG